MISFNEQVNYGKSRCDSHILSVKNRLKGLDVLKKFAEETKQGIKAFFLRNPAPPLQMPKLANIGNTCYGNTIIQILYHSDAFRNIVLYDNVRSNNEFYMIFKELFHSMAQKDPKDFRRNLLKQIFQAIDTKTQSVRALLPIYFF